MRSVRPNGLLSSIGLGQPYPLLVSLFLLSQYRAFVSMKCLITLFLTLSDWKVTHPPRLMGGKRYISLSCLLSRVDIQFDLRTMLILILVWFTVMVLAGWVLWERYLEKIGSQPIMPLSLWKQPHFSALCGVGKHLCLYQLLLLN